MLECFLFYHVDGKIVKVDTALMYSSTDSFNKYLHRIHQDVSKVEGARVENKKNVVSSPINLSL